MEKSFHFEKAWRKTNEGGLRWEKAEENCGCWTKMNGAAIKNKKIEKSIIFFKKSVDKQYEW